MIRLPITIILTVIPALFAGIVAAADLGVPNLSPPMATHDYLSTEKLLKTGVRLEQGDDLIFEPQLAIGHAKLERETKSGFDEITHTIHARAGGKIDLFQTISLSAAAKYPVYTVQSSDRWIPGATFSQPGARRYGYDIFRSTDNLSWTGEIGIRVGNLLDLNVFYDQNRFDYFPGSTGVSGHDDRFGTRLIFRFQ